MARYIDGEPLLAEQYEGFDRANETDWQKGYWTGIDEMCEKIKAQPTANVVEVVQSLWKQTTNEKPDSTRHLIVANGSLISYHGYYLKPKGGWYKTFECEEEIEVPAFWMDMPVPPKESIYGECTVMDREKMQDNL